MPRLSTDPYAYPGRIVSDSQTSCKPANRVLITNPDLVRVFGLNGHWNEELRQVDYAEGVPEHGAILDVEAGLRVVIDALRRLDRDRATTTSLLRSLMHGAIAEGLRLSAAKGSRHLHMSGGVAIIFDRDEGGGYAVNRYTIPVLNPLRYYVAAGATLIADGLHTALPGVCAGEAPGEAVAWPAKTYRVDTLALIPSGEDPVPEWYLFLGSPTDVRSVTDVPNIQTPSVPAEYAGEVLPLYRITSRQGDKGIWGIDQIANRINGV